MFKRIRLLSQLVSFRELRNAVLGFSVVIGGLGLAFVTYYAHRTGNLQLAGIAATASLVFVLLIIIFVVPPLARSANAEASQMNLPFEFTTGGAVFIGLLIIVAFAAWNTGNNLLFLVLSFITSALVISFIAGNLCLKKLDVKMRFPETIYAGESTPIIVSLHNRKRIFPTFSVTAEVRGRERQISRLIGEFRKVLPEKWAVRISRPPLVKYVLDYFVFVPRKGSIEGKVEHIFDNRGRFIIHDFELSTRFPFGFFRHRRRLPAQKAEIVIFPKFEPVDKEALGKSLEAGKLSSTSSGTGQDLFALRDYHPMDDLRRVDWKATARTSNLTVREFTAEDDNFVTVIFDPWIAPTTGELSMPLRQRIAEEQNRKEPTGTLKRFERGVSKCGSLIQHFEQEGADIRLILGTNDSGFGNGREHLNKCLKRLALVEPHLREGDVTERFKRLYGKCLFERVDSHIFYVTSHRESQIPRDHLEKGTVLTY